MRRLVLPLLALAALPLAAQDFEADPLYALAELEAGFEPDPFTVDVVAGGPTPNPVEGPDCVGYIEAAQPDVALDYTAAEGVDLGIGVAGDGDTALLVRTPAGDWLCNDDADGLDPRVAVRAPESGRYAVWVATYSQSPIEATLFLTGALPSEREAALPDLEADPLYGDVRLQSGFSPDPNTVELLAGGPARNPVEGDECVGYLDRRQPAVTVTYEASAVWDLAFVARSESDTALLVRGPDGAWRCSDDAEGADPRVEVAAPASGAYHVWVATFEEDPAPATLGITEVLRAAPAPDHEAPPTFGRYAAGGGTTEIPVEAGGEPRTPITGFGCVGYLTADRPSAVVGLEGPGPATFRLEARTDAALLVRTPSGDWLCDDDTDGLEAQVAVAEPGDYAVWVASFGGAATPAALAVTGGE